MAVCCGPIYRRLSGVDAECGNDLPQPGPFRCPQRPKAGLPGAVAALGLARRQTLAGQATQTLDFAPELRERFGGKAEAQV